MAQIRQERNRLAIFPLVLIAVGAIWLLFEARVFSSANLYVLLRFWPVILIGIGLELLIGRGSSSLSLLIGLGTIVVLLALMLVGPALGLAPSMDIKENQYSQPLTGLTSADVTLELSSGQANVKALSDSNELISADLRYVGDITFNATSSNGRGTVRLGAQNDQTQIINFLGWSLVDGIDENALRWNIGLAPNIPLNLSINGGVGDSTIDLTGLQISHLTLNSGVGNQTITLPATGDFNFTLHGGVGSTRITIPDGVAVAASINAGVGDMHLDVPDNAPVRLEVNGGLGDVSVPGAFTRLSGSDSGFDHSGVWETANYASADASTRITIRFDGGVGKLSIQ